MVKRGILFFIATFVTITQSFAFGVTFQVDMSNQTVSPNGVRSDKKYLAREPVQ